MSTYSKLFEAADDTLRAAFLGSSLTETGRALSRTSSNREHLVLELLAQLLPTATRSVSGAVLVDAHGNESGDVDVAILAPWGVPVWPFQLHPVVPCEGVISAILCETTNPGPTAKVWEQVGGARSLFKTVEPNTTMVNAGGGTAGFGRAYVPNVGVWCWGNSPEPSQLLAHLPPVEAGKEALVSAARVHHGALARGPETPEFEDFLDRVVAQGPRRPNWVYWHGKERDGSMFAFRRHRLAKDGKWNHPHLLPGLRDDLDVVYVDAGRSDRREWEYGCIRGSAGSATALQALVAYLSTQVLLYGAERPCYGKYVSR